MSVFVQHKWWEPEPEPETYSNPWDLMTDEEMEEEFETAVAEMEMELT